MFLSGLYKHYFHVFLKKVEFYRDLKKDFKNRVKTFRWTDILKDLHMESPNYYDIRRQEKGVITKNTKKTGTNLHCIIGFYKQ